MTVNKGLGVAWIFFFWRFLEDCNISAIQYWYSQYSRILEDCGPRIYAKHVIPSLKQKLSSKIHLTWQKCSWHKELCFLKTFLLFIPAPMERQKSVSWEFMPHLGNTSLYSYSLTVCRSELLLVVIWSMASEAQRSRGTETRLKVRSVLLPLGVSRPVNWDTVWQSWCQASNMKKILVTMRGRRFYTLQNTWLWTF